MSPSESYNFCPKHFSRSCVPGEISALIFPILSNFHLSFLKRGWNELTKEYQRNIADSLLKSSNDESTNVEEDWKNIKCAILSAADQIIGKKQFRRNQD